MGGGGLGVNITLRMFGLQAGGILESIRYRDMTFCTLEKMTSLNAGCIFILSLLFTLPVSKCNPSRFKI